MRIALLIFALTLFSCQRSYYIDNLTGNPLNDNIIFDLDLNIEIPLELKNNLVRFSYAKINLSATAYQNKTKLDDILVERTIRYDRWNEMFIIQNSNTLFDARFSNYKEMVKELTLFKNLQFKRVDSSEDKYDINVDFTLLSTYFPAPLKILEFDKRFGNVKKRNLKFLLYAK